MHDLKNVGFYVDEGTAREMEIKFGSLIDTVKSDRLDGLASEILVIAGAVGAFTFSNIKDIIKFQIEKENSIDASIGGNEYKNLNEETLLKLLENEESKLSDEA